MPSHNNQWKACSAASFCIHALKKTNQWLAFPCLSSKHKEKALPIQRYVHLACSVCALCWEQGLLPKECSFHILWHAHFGAVWALLEKSLRVCSQQVHLQRVLLKTHLFRFHLNNEHGCLGTHKDTRWQFFSCYKLPKNMQSEGSEEHC